MVFLFAMWMLVEIRGVVTDPAGLAIPGARVRAGEIETSTDEQGRFVLRGDVQFPLQVVVDSAGFEAAARSVDRDGAGKELRIALELAGQQQQVTVQEQAEPASLDSAANADRVEIDRGMLERLPVLDGDALAALMEWFAPGGGAQVVIDGIESDATRLSATQIAEVKINANPYSAEYSRVGRGRIEIRTRKGTQDWRGSLSLSLRDSSLDARQAFAAEKPDERRWRWSGTATGGLGSRTSLLISLEGEDDRAQSLVFARTLAGEVRENVATPETERELTVSVDHRMREGSAMGVRYQWEREREANSGAGGFQLAETAADQRQQEHEVQVWLRTLLGQRWLSESTVRIESEEEATVSRNPGLPRIVVQDAFTGGGAQADARTKEREVRFSQVFSRAAGKHYLRLGAQSPGIASVLVEDRTNRAGVYRFATLDDYAAGRALLYTARQGDGLLRYRVQGWSGFVQDEYRWGERMLLSAGLRWEWRSTLAADKGNFGPRLGWAWKPSGDGRTVIRAGAGLFYDFLDEGEFARTMLLDGTRLREVFLRDASYPVSSGSNLSQTPPNVVHVGEGVGNPRIVAASLGVERELRGGVSASLVYQATRGLGLFGAVDRNAPPEATAGRPDDAFGQVQTIGGWGRSRQDTVEATARGRWGRWFSGTVQGAWERRLSDTEGSGWLPANSYLPAAEWGRADGNRRWRLQVATAGRYFDVGVTARVRSGEPYTLTTGIDDNGDGAVNDRPAGVARNTLTGSGEFTIDFRVRKEFRFGSGGNRRLELVADSFNAPNRVNYSRFSGNLRSPYFGQPVAARTARRMQFSMRWTF
jgi:hypothetical protein